MLVVGELPIGHAARRLEEGDQTGEQREGGAEGSQQRSSGRFYSRRRELLQRKAVGGAAGV